MREREEAKMIFRFPACVVGGGVAPAERDVTRRRPGLREKENLVLDCYRCNGVYV